MAKLWKHEVQCRKRMSNGAETCNCSINDGPGSMVVGAVAGKPMMRRVFDYNDCKEPGDFYWQTQDPNDPRTYKPTQPGERPSYIGFNDELGQFHHIPISPVKNTGNGATWEWNGNLEVPSLTPSILSFYDRHKDGVKTKPVQRIVLWHGYITAGRLCPCDDSPKERRLK